MDENLIPETLVRFGVFEVDLASGELRKSGVRLRLGGQPFQVLAFLLRNPGKLVRREELKQELWADDTFVDFENGVNTAIRKIRRVLDDSADTPRYIETLPRRGYRFIGKVEGRPQDATPPPHPTPPSPVPAWKTWLPWALLAVMASAWIVASQLPGPPDAVGAVTRFSFAPQAELRVRGSARAVAVSPNGRHIAFAATGEKRKLWVQDLDGREPRAIAGTEGAQGPFWSPDSSFIGFVASGEVRRVPAQGGPAAALCDLPRGYDGGSWSPDGEVIVFGSGGNIYELPARGGAPTPLIQSSDAPSEGATQLYRNPHFLPAEAGRRVLLFTRWIFGDATKRDASGPRVRPANASRPRRLSVLFEQRPSRLPTQPIHL